MSLLINAFLNFLLWYGFIGFLILCQIKICLKFKLNSIQNLADKQLTAHTHAAEDLWTKTTFFVWCNSQGFFSTTMV